MHGVCDDDDDSSMCVKNAMLVLVRDESERRMGGNGEIRVRAGRFWVRATEREGWDGDISNEEAATAPRGGRRRWAGCTNAPAAVRDAGTGVFVLRVGPWVL